MFQFLNYISQNTNMVFLEKILIAFKLKSVSKLRALETTSGWSTEKTLSELMHTNSTCDEAS